MVLRSFGRGRPLNAPAAFISPVPRYDCEVSRAASSQFLCLIRNVFPKRLLLFRGVPRGERFPIVYDCRKGGSMRKSVLGIFTVAALAASVAIDVAAAQMRDDGSRRGGGAAISGGAETTQPTPPSGGGPGKLPSAGQIPPPTSEASKRADTVPATGMGKPPSAGEIPAAGSSARAESTGRVKKRSNR